jgi:hypothetical protein
MCFPEILPDLHGYGEFAANNAESPRHGGMPWESRYHEVFPPFCTPPHLPERRPMTDASTPAKSDIDPLVHSSLREALIVSSIWFAAMVWSITVCWTMGYGRTKDELKLVFGFPDWIFWGIVVPWLTCTIVSWIFGAWFVRDGELGKDVEDADELGLGG